jgi:hypothetical protein
LEPAAGNLGRAAEIGSPKDVSIKPVKLEYTHMTRRDNTHLRKVAFAIATWIAGAGVMTGGAVAEEAGESHHCSSGVATTRDIETAVAKIRAANAVTAEIVDEFAGGLQKCADLQLTTSGYTPDRVDKVSVEGFLRMAWLSTEWADMVRTGAK